MIFTGRVDDRIVVKGAGKEFVHELPNHKNGKKHQAKTFVIFMIGCWLKVYLDCRTKKINWIEIELFLQIDFWKGNILSPSHVQCQVISENDQKITEKIENTEFRGDVSTKSLGFLRDITKMSVNNSQEINNLIGTKIDRCYSGHMGTRN